MKTLIALAAILQLSTTGMSLAQEAGQGSHGSMDHSAPGGAAPADSAMPAACNPTPADAGGTSMSGMGDMNGLDAVQKANHAAMTAMHGPMMAAAMIKDADLAFNCGMIAHHRGAIAMAEVELEQGKDDASKALARAIIAAQEKEIAEMTAWVESHEP